MTPYDDDIMHPKLPSWMPMGVQPSGGTQQSQGGGFVDALKKRLSSPQMKEGAAGAKLGEAAVGGAASGAGGGGASL